MEYIMYVNNEGIIASIFSVEDEPKKWVNLNCKNKSNVLPYPINEVTAICLVQQLNLKRFK